VRRLENFPILRIAKLQGLLLGDIADVPILDIFISCSSKEP